MNTTDLSSSQITTHLWAYAEFVTPETTVKGLVVGGNPAINPDTVSLKTHPERHEQVDVELTDAKLNDWVAHEDYHDGIATLKAKVNYE